MEVPAVRRLSSRVAAALTLGAVLFVAACGASGSNETTYWRQSFTNGDSLSLSLQTDGENAAGWAEYGDGTFQHFTGTKNSDGTFSIGAYTGRTLTIDGDSMTATTYQGTDHWTKI